MAKIDTSDYDITGKVGSLYPATHDIEWPMYSYDRPAYKLWNAIGKRLTEHGWTEGEVKAWLQSKDTRHALDGALGDAIEKLGAEFADSVRNDRRA